MRSHDWETLNPIFKLFLLNPALKLDGVDVRGYTYTSLVDDYVWQYGCNRTFGIVSGASGNLKDSAAAYAEIINDRGILEEDNSTHDVSQEEDGGSGGKNSDGTESKDCNCPGKGSTVVLAFPLFMSILFRSFLLFL